jgi:hypothetical protein
MGIPERDQEKWQEIGLKATKLLQVIEDANRCLDASFKSITRLFELQRDCEASDRRLEGPRSKLQPGAFALVVVGMEQHPLALVIEKTADGQIRFRCPEIEEEDDDDENFKGN